MPARVLAARVARVALVALAAAAQAGHAAAPRAVRAPAPAPAPPERPDTSRWACSRCPFFHGNSGQVQAGMLYANGANASYGRYTGLDHTGGYADAAASGQWAGRDGAYLNYRFEDLGLPARGGDVDGGQAGRYDLQLIYQGQPERLYDTTATPYLGAGSPSLTLPSDWVRASSTAAMAALDSSLSAYDIGFNRSSVALLGQLFATTQWTLFADFSHQQENGSSLGGGSFLTEAVQLPEPIDYQTNTLEAGASWAGRIASVRIAYTGSWFQDDNASLSWQNPYLPLVAGSDAGRLALPPSNTLQQGSLTGNVRVPLFSATTLTYSASLGRLGQDAAFLPTSTLPDSTLPAPGALNADVQLSHYRVALASRVLAALYLRGSATYDGRDDRTAPLKFTQVITDELPGGEAITPLYSEDRTHLEGSADYRFLRWLKLGTAGDYLRTRFSPGQLVDETGQQRAWGYLDATPLSAFSVSAKAGSSTRRAGPLDTAALPPGENPLLLAYEYAPLQQQFIDLSAGWTLSAALSWALQSRWDDDTYPLSRLGLQGGRDRDLSSTLNWTPRSGLSVYFDGGYQRLTALQNGAIGDGSPLWQLSDAQYFWTGGGGGQWVPRPRWSLTLDYMHAGTRANELIAAGAPAQLFPQIDSTLDSLTLAMTYQWSAALRLRLRYGFEHFGSNDWALQGVYADTVPNLLAMGAQPYREDVNLVGASFLYSFGRRAAAASP
ncbi:MAG TPA: MtrB/PioB family decaheme-associated outer membrane protein [Steroidobacteraceae bacterium]|nr:MtrB/PioB family decaheme-associated outer membrane protein [Steroidobacteraceae bacterium]